MQKGIGTGAILVTLIVFIAVIVLAVAYIGYQQTTAALIQVKQCPDDYDGSIDLSGLDDSDYPTVGTASGNNITLTNFTSDSQTKKGYFSIEIDGEICGFDEITIEKHSGASLPDYVKLASAKILDEDSGTVIKTFEKDEDERKIEDWTQNLRDDLVIEIEFESYATPTSNITEEVAWDVNVEAKTDDDDDSDTGYIKGSFTI